VRTTDTESECPLATASRSPAGLNAICDGREAHGYVAHFFPVFTFEDTQAAGLGGAGDGVGQDHRAGGGRGGLAVCRGGGRRDW